MKFNKKFLPVIIAVPIVIILVLVYFLVLRKVNPNTKAVEQVETPPSVAKINDMALAQRPYVELIPHSNKATCDGVDLNITNLKNGEEKAEYELEYTTEKLIQGVFGNRDLVKQEEHKPLEFGTCSKGACKCDNDINGGSLKLTFTGKINYVLKGDFKVGSIADNKGILVSKDVRLSLDLNGAIDDKQRVMIASTMGLPADLSSKVILGPYGIFVQDLAKFEKPLKVSLQSKDVATGKVQFWDGTKWNVLTTQINADKAEFTIEKTGVIVLTE
ncbi:hypothetical protein GYA19_03925 [Candidatus Beckwithbacteria bacterium]|nr:hypothetical protein [Candidatus Beckwithbacteria bacterium]